MTYFASRGILSLFLSLSFNPALEITFALSNSNISEVSVISVAVYVPVLKPSYSYPSLPILIKSLVRSIIELFDIERRPLV